MWNKPLRKLSLDSHHVGRQIDIFLAAHIAADPKRFVYRRARRDRVRMAKRDFMSIDEVSRNVVDIVLAHYSPTVRNVLVHGLLSAKANPMGLSAFIEEYFTRGNNWHRVFL